MGVETGAGDPNTIASRIKIINIIQKNRKKYIENKSDGLLRTASIGFLGS